MTRRVLVVDDNGGYRLLVRLALAGSAFEVVGEATDLAEGRSLAASTRPDVVLVDLHLAPVPVEDSSVEDGAVEDDVAALRAAAPGAVLLAVSSLADLDPAGAGSDGLALLPRGTPPKELAAALARALEQRPPEDVQASERSRFPPETTSAKAARRFAGEVMVRWGCADDVRDTVLLLLSEVVSNAVLHARTELEVRIAALSARVRIEVVDGDTGPIHRRASTADAQSGRGTELVEALAEAWGTDRLTTGKRVWFEVAHPGTATSTGEDG